MPTDQNPMSLDGLPSWLRDFVRQALHETETLRENGAEQVAVARRQGVNPSRYRLELVVLPATCRRLAGRSTHARDTEPARSVETSEEDRCRCLRAPTTHGVSFSPSGGSSRRRLAAHSPPWSRTATHTASRRRLCSGRLCHWQPWGARTSCRSLRPEA